jgi:hypothetical protein
VALDTIRARGPDLIEVGLREETGRLPARDSERP